MTGPHKVVVTEWMSLDGVVQAPIGDDEDPSGGFAHGGWHARYFDEMSQAWILAGLQEAGAFLFGRCTYEAFAGHWPTAGAEEQVVADPLNSKPKYVASTTLVEPLAWAHSSLLEGDLAEAVTQVATEATGDLHVLGSPGLVRSLLQLGLVDELRLMIDPVLLGGGKRTFPDLGRLHPLSLVSSQVATSGSILATYATQP
jgi:dihydrofolate reductase